MLIGILQFLGGLGFFLFGMSFLEKTVSSFSHGGFKNLLQRITSSNIKAFGSGIIITTLLQSSSVVSVLILAFVGTSIISLTSALAIILGSNIGTMITTGILGIVGLSFNVSIIAFPLIFLGAIGISFFSHRDKIINISKFLLSFGIIFLAFSFMKEGLAFLTDINLASFTQSNIWIPFLIGLLFSTLVQSGTLVFIITLAAVSTGIIDPMSGFAIAFGTYLGSTATIILGAIGANKSASKKQVALWHVGFNFITSIAGIFCLPIIIKLFNTIEPKFGIIISFTLIYILWRTIFAIGFLPFVPTASGLLQKYIKQDKSEVPLAIKQIINAENLDPNIALLTVKQDMLLLFWNSIKYNLTAWDFSISTSNDSDSTQEALISTLGFQGNGNTESLSKIYHNIKYIQNELLEFLISLPVSEKSNENTILYQSVISVLDSCKSIKDVYHHIEDRKRSNSEHLKNDYENMRKLVLMFYTEILHLYQNLGSKKAMSNAKEALDVLQKENDDFLSEIHPHKNDDIALTAIIQTRRYFSQSCQDLLHAMELCHIETDEIEHFKTKVVPFMK